jgi:ATP phosphoribosyltransferase regulatory subunit
MAFFHALVAGLTAEALGPIRDAVDHKNVPRLVDALDRADISGSQRDLLLGLPDLVGGLEVLRAARLLASHLHHPDLAIAALDRIFAVHRLLDAYGISDRVILDLGEVRGMDYYTGITFRGVAPGLGWPIVSGGRYDDLITHYGRSMPAVGFGLGIERALLVQMRQGGPAPSIAADALFGLCEQPACLSLVQNLRRIGCRIEVDPLNSDPQALMRQAQQRGIMRSLYPTIDGWLLTDEQGERALTSAELLQIAQTWISPQETDQWNR